MSAALIRTTTPTARATGRAEQVSAWTGWLRVMLRTIATRRHLARMDDRMLRDIGLSRCEALAEADRAPWDIDPLTQRRRR